MEGQWSDTWRGSPGDDVLAAALDETEARASTLDLENARLRLALVPNPSHALHSHLTLSHEKSTGPRFIVEIGALHWICLDPHYMYCRAL